MKINSIELNNVCYTFAPVDGDPKRFEVFCFGHRIAELRVNRNGSVSCLEIQELADEINKAIRKDSSSIEEDNSMESEDILEYFELLNSEDNYKIIYDLHSLKLNLGYKYSNGNYTRIKKGSNSFTDEEIIQIIQRLIYVQQQDAPNTYRAMVSKPNFAKITMIRKGYRALFYIYKGVHYCVGYSKDLTHLSPKEMSELYKNLEEKVLREYYVES